MLGKVEEAGEKYWERKFKSILFQIRRRKGMGRKERDRMVRGESEEN